MASRPGLETSPTTSMVDCCCVQFMPEARLWLGMFFCQILIFVWWPKSGKQTKKLLLLFHSTGYLTIRLKFNHDWKLVWQPTIFWWEIHGSKYISWPCSPESSSLLAQPLVYRRITGSVSAPKWQDLPVVVVTIKLVISLSLYPISFIHFNHGLWEAPMFRHERRLLKRAEL